MLHRTVINVGAGSGSYEPLDRTVTPVEPSAAMRRQRPSHLPAAVDAVAERLPFPAAAFDAAMATFTVHQWQQLQAGLRELRRVTRGPLCILTCDPERLQEFWLQRYCPEVLTVEGGRYPSVAAIASALPEDDVSAQPVPIPLLCRDGFNEAYYGRPERLLEREARQACSAWSFVQRDVVERFEALLRDDLLQGRWDAEYGHLRSQAEYEGSLILIVARPKSGGVAM